MTKFQKECLDYKERLRIRRVESLQKELESAIADGESAGYIEHIRNRMLLNKNKGV